MSIASFVVITIAREKSFLRNGKYGSIEVITKNNSCSKNNLAMQALENLAAVQRDSLDVENLLEQVMDLLFPRQLK